jgi:hypothetical protein
MQTTMAHVLLEISVNELPMSVFSFPSAGRQRTMPAYRTPAFLEPSLMQAYHLDS